MRIQGVAGAKLFTLDECRQTDQSITVPGFVREQYHVQSIFVGAHIDPDGSLEFVSVQLQMDHLRTWVGRTGTRVDRTPGDNSKGIRQIRITYEPLEKDWLEVVKVRVNQIVHRGLGRDIDGSRLYDLTESLYYLVVLCLLKECGVPVSAFSNIKQHQRFRQLGHRLSGLQ